MLANPIETGDMWDEFSVSANIRAYVHAIAYEQTDLLCYSYGQLMSHSKENQDQELSDQTFFQLFLKDARFRRSLEEWLFLNSDALAQAISNSDFNEELAMLEEEREQAAQSWWGRVKTLLGSGQPNTYSFSARYTQYVTYLVESSGFQIAIQHCALSNGLDPEELESAMKEAILSYNRRVGLGTGFFVLVTTFAATPYLIRPVIRGLAMLGRGIKYLWTIKNHIFPRGPQPLSLRHSVPTTITRIPKISPAQQEVLRREMQRITEVKTYFRSTMARFSVMNHIAKVPQRAFEGSLILYFTNEMIENVEANQDQLPHISHDTRWNEAQQSGLFQNQSHQAQIAKKWWEGRFSNYEKLIARGLRLERLERHEPHHALEDRRVFDPLLDFYLADYGIIERELKFYRESLVELEQNIRQICPTTTVDNVDRSKLANDPMAYSFYMSNNMQEIGTYNCRRRNQETLQEFQQNLLEVRHSRKFRILRMIFPLFQFRKEQLETSLEHTWGLHQRVLFEIMRRNKEDERSYGWCRYSSSLSQEDSYRTSLCRFHWLYTQQELQGLNEAQTLELQSLTSVLEQYFSI